MIQVWRRKSVQSQPRDARELAARQATARELAVLRGDSAAIFGAVAFAVLDSALHVSLIGLLAVVGGSFVILIFRVSKARLWSRGRVAPGKLTGRDATANEPASRSTSDRVGRGETPRHFARWLAAAPMYAGLAALLIAHEDGMSGLGAFAVAMVAVIAVTVVMAAVERLL